MEMEMPNEYLNRTSNLDDTTALKTLQKELDDAISDENEDAENDDGYHLAGEIDVNIKVSNTNAAVFSLLVEQLYRAIDTVNKGYIADLNTNIVARYKIDDVQSGS